MALKNMSNKDIEIWLKSVQYLLDSPEVYTRDMNSVVRVWEESQEKIKFCFTSLVEYSAFIANMGVAILYETLNRRDDVVAERSYYPEQKLRRRMVKEGIPHFSKETFHRLKEFDILGFSSYYPLQYFGVPDILTMSGLSYLSEKRKEEDPIVILGGVAAFNPSPVHKFFDAIFLGDGEKQLEEALDIYKSAKLAGARKDDILYSWATRLDGIYVPKWYNEIYDGKTNRVVSHIPLRNDIPVRIKKHVAEISQIYPLTSMFVSNSEGQEMSAGSLEITRGCGNKCQFCEGSFRSQPYRERPVEMIKEGFSKLIKETGVRAVTPYGFNLSDHHKINEIIYFLLEDEDRKVSMSSQHIDHLNEEFARTAYASGNRSITVAIETPTDRMRAKVAKNLTEERILDAFRIMFETGFSKIKVYMIANLPEEGQEDIDYLVVLAKKIHDIQYSVQGDTMKTKVRFSWTPFNGKAHTPLQFAEVYKIDEATGLPILPKTLTTVLDSLRELGYGMRIGTDSELSVINQCLSFGDRRMADVIEDVFHDKNFNYRGGMSIGLKKPMIDFLAVLKKYNLNYKHFMREKDPEEVFSWDFINMGITKKFLKRAYFDNFKNAKNLARCQEECEHCGGCTSISKELFNKYWHNKLDPDRHDVLELLEKRLKKQTVLRYRFKINVSSEYRFVHSSKIKNYVRRAFMRCEIPIRNDLTFSSDKIKFNNWSYGFDYGEISCWTKDFDRTNIAERLNESMRDERPFAFVSVEEYSDTASNFTGSFEDILYGFSIPKLDRPKSNIDENINKVIHAKEFTIKLKVLGDKKDTTKTIEFDARPYIVNIWTVDKGKNVAVYALLKDLIGVYELFPAVFSTSKRNILKYPVKRINYLMSKNESSLDMFASICSECDREIEEDLLGEHVHENLCIMHSTINR